MNLANRSFPIVLTLLCGLVAACGPGGERGATGAAARGPSAAPVVQTYLVRGEVTALPDRDDPTTALYIHHEAIDEFTDIDGDVVGMNAMTMPFPLAEGVSLAGVAPGDKVRFTLEVEWEGDPPYRLGAIEKLPADSELEYRKARPGGPPEEAAETEG